MGDGEDAPLLVGCTAAITPLIEAAGLPHLAPLTGASSLRKAELKKVFHLRVSYTDEITRLVHNLVNMGIRDLAIVYLDNPYGKELAEDAKRALASSGIVNPTLVPLAQEGFALTAHSRGKRLVYAGRHQNAGHHGRCLAACQALASIRNLDLGGFTVDYGSSGARVGSKYVELAVMTGDGRLKV